MNVTRKIEVYPCMFCRETRDYLANVRDHMHECHGKVYWRDSTWERVEGRIARFNCPYCQETIEADDAGLRSEHEHLEQCHLFLMAMVLAVS